MKTLLTLAVLALGSLTSCSTMDSCCGSCGDSCTGQCATEGGMAKAAMALDSRCILTGQALDADSPRTTYEGRTIGFCCAKCEAKWNAMDAGQKAAAFEQACASCKQ